MKLSRKVYKPVWITFQNIHGGRITVRPMNVSAVGQNHERQMRCLRRRLRKRRQSSCVLFLSSYEFITIKGTMAQAKAKINAGVRAELERIAAAGELVRSIGMKRPDADRNSRRRRAA